MTARCALYMGALNIRDSLTTPTATIPNIFHGLFVPIDPMNIPTKFEVPISHIPNSNPTFAIGIVILPVMVQEISISGFRYLQEFKDGR